MKSDTILKEAKRLHSLGFAIIWLHPKTKRPVESGWTTGERSAWGYLAETYQKGMNFGVRLGTPSKIGQGYLAVVDVDVKSTEEHHRMEAVAAARGLVGKARLPVVLSGRGNGSRHYYCLTAKSFKTFNPAQSNDIVKVHMPSKRPSKKELAELSKEEINAGIRLSHAWEVSLYSDGRQVVLPPSIHPDSGNPYQWRIHVQGVDDIPLIEFNVPETEEPDSTSPKAKLEIESHDFKIEEVELDWLPISDKIKEGILHGTDVADRSGFLLPATTALLHAGLNTNEILTVLTDPNSYLGACAFEHAKTKSRARAADWLYKYTVKRVIEERSVENAFAGINDGEEEVFGKTLSPEEMEKQNAEIEGERKWWQDLDRTQHGSVKVTFKNLKRIFQNSFDGVLFKKDLFANRIAYGIDTDWGGVTGKYIEDVDLLYVKNWFAESRFKIEPASSLLLDVVNFLAHQEGVHPVRDYLSGLTWDGKSRINTWIKDYCQGTAVEPYLSEVSRKFLLAMVKRVFEPGCQWDYVLVLEGEQGKYKSSIARALAGDRWFMDNLPDLKDKDAMLNLQGKWLIELGELTNVKRSDYNLVKAYLVRRTDTVRPHYGRLVEESPRQSVFIGTVNEGQYLKDPTGNRRYWPVRVGECDVAGLTEARDQLFAEAMHLYKTENEVLKLSSDATMQATEVQEDRRVEDDETEMHDAFAEFLNGDQRGDLNLDRFKIRDLFEGVNAPWGRWSDKNYAVQNGAHILRKMGFERKKSDGQRIWFRKGIPENRAEGVRPEFENSDFE